MEIQRNILIDRPCVGAGIRSTSRLAGRQFVIPAEGDVAGALTVVGYKVGVTGGFIIKINIRAGRCFCDHRVDAKR